MRRILSTLNRWWMTWLCYATAVLFIALIAAGSFLHSPGFTVAAWSVLGVDMAITAAYAMLTVRAYRRLRASRRARKVTR